MTSKHVHNSEIQPSSKLGNTIVFEANKKLSQFASITIESPNKKKEKEANTKNDNQEVTNNNVKNSDTVINKLKECNEPDAGYNYKKDFLVLSFNQTEDQNSLEYKRKILAKKLMTDITFSLNMAFEFSFEDKIKNNLIMTLSKNNQNYYDYSDKKDNTDSKDIKIDNEYILNFCNGDMDMNAFFKPPEDNNLKNDAKDKNLITKNMKEDLVNSVMEDERENAKQFEIVNAFSYDANYIADEQFDQKTFDFFSDFIEKYKEEPIAAKVKLILSYIQEKNPNTNKCIYTNKEKNEIMRIWKEEYDQALNLYRNKIRLENEKKKKESKKLINERNSMTHMTTTNAKKKKSTRNVGSSPNININNINEFRAGGNEMSGLKLNRMVSARIAPYDQDRISMMKKKITNSDK